MCDFTTPSLVYLIESPDKITFLIGSGSGSGYGSGSGSGSGSCSGSD